MRNPLNYFFAGQRNLRADTAAFKVEKGESGHGKRFLTAKPTKQTKRITE
jgi:hypothetical protein